MTGSNDASVFHRHAAVDGSCAVQNAAIVNRDGVGAERVIDAKLSKQFDITRPCDDARDRAVGVGRIQRQRAVAHRDVAADLQRAAGTQRDLES